MKLTISHERVLSGAKLDVLHQPCAIHSKIKLRREGLFRRLWQLTLGMDQADGIDPFELREWLPWDKDRIFYRPAPSLRNANSPCEKTLLLIHVDPFMSPHYVIDDYLRAYAAHQGHHPASLECLLIPGKVTYDRHAEYVHMIYLSLAEVLGYVPKIRSVESLLKAVHLHNYSFVSLGLEWVCADSFIKHLLLSKGASELDLDMRENVFERVKAIRLSAYHELELLRIPQAPPRQQMTHDSFRRLNQIKKGSPDPEKLTDAFKAVAYRKISERGSAG